MPLRHYYHRNNHTKYNQVMRKPAHENIEELAALRAPLLAHRLPLRPPAARGREGAEVPARVAGSATAHG